MAEFIEDSSGSGQLESTTIGVFRSAATVKGGKRFSFGALVAVGDRNGRIALGYAKANEVPPAIEKAQKDGKKRLQRVTLHGKTIPHTVEGRYSSSKVRLIPASPGTGVIAGATVRAVLELVGVTDCLTKAYGSTNSKNLAKAALDALSQLRARELVSELRGITIEKTDVDDLLSRGQAFMPAKREGAVAKGPVNKLGQEKGRGRGGPRGGGGGGGRGPRGGFGGRGGGGGVGGGGGGGGESPDAGGGESAPQS
ncbi:MAG: 30S ribosomal protein S5 [Planctomycetota bacterium]|nr:30S ribosomal protein S5 [Planctomycetota bacterium]